MNVLERWPSGLRRSPAKGVWTNHPSRVRIPPSPPIVSYVFIYIYITAPVAQLDRVPGYELGGREFESLRARHLSDNTYSTHKPKISNN